MPSPLVSVAMSVHNGERFLTASIECILAQTLGDLEFIIIDDGSSDATPDIVAHYAGQDGRIVSVRRENKGLTKSLNEALALARAAHPEDDGRFTRYIPLERTPRIYAHQRDMAPLR